MNKLLLLILVAVGSAYGQASSPEFIRAASRSIERTGITLAEACPIAGDPVARRVFAEYGSMFVAAHTVTPPPKCVFRSDEEVAKFQSGVESKRHTFGSVTIELQSAAMDALLSAVAEARKKGLSITPRGRTTSAKRSYSDTSRIWNSRFEPALRHWQARGKITKAEADEARAMETHEQVVQVMKWEEDSLWFNTNFSRTIFSSVAAPGTSQHLSMIALDVTQFADKRVRKILNEHGWFQTIANDTPHFTYLGHDEDDLPDYGLKAVNSGGFKFWVPDVTL